MKKKRIITALIIIILINGIILGYYFYNVKETNKFNLPNTVEVENIYVSKIEDYQKEYNNTDIKATIYIEDTDFNSLVVQTTDNDYYLSHLPDKTKNKIGSVFFDYRIDIETSKKILIFGHSSWAYDLPIEVIENYKDYSFYENHQYIYLDTETKHRTFKIIGAYVETNNWDYMKVNFTSDEEREKHYQKLLSKAFYDTGETITSDDTLLIVQTCSHLPEFKNFKKKYFLLLAKEI